MEGNLDLASKLLAGRFTILSVSGLLLLLQLWIEYPYYVYRWWRDMEGFGADTPAIYRYAPWWSLAFASAVLLGVLIYSWRNRGPLGRAWWYVVLPLIAAVTTALVLSASTLEIAHHRLLLVP